MNCVIITYKICMKKYSKIFKRIMSLFIIIAMLLCNASDCFISDVYAKSIFGIFEKDKKENESLEGVVLEGTIIEGEKTEKEIVENTKYEGYVLEKEIVEKEITELLLEDKTVEDVISCQTIYVSQNNIDEFSKNSQTAQLFGNNMDISSVLKKLAIGTGVIVTVVVLKKAGLPDPVASVVIKAADDSLNFAKAGAAIGGIYGGATGAANEIDKSGTASSLIGFATATAGLVLTIVSFVGAIPSGGSTTLTVPAGIKLVLAGTSMVAASAETVAAGKNAITKIISTDSKDINWNDIDWGKVGISSIEKAVSNSSDGYMCGAIIGTVYGGVDGYDYYHKYGAPYTSKADRIKFLEDATKKAGKWTGKVGESDYILKKAIKLKDGTKVNRITYKNGIPDFSQYAKAEVDIKKMTGNRSTNFKQADEVLADYWTRIKYEGKTWTARDIEIFRSANKLSWHEMSNMKSMQLVPTEINSQFKHFGGVAECNAYDRLMGGVESGEFD